jgi:hypothetical protein
MTRWDWRSLQQVVVEQAVVDSMHYTTVARILAAASLHPHRSRYWKTATSEARFVTKAAGILWRYERVASLTERGEVVLCLDEQPHLQALARRVPTQLMRCDPRARRLHLILDHGASHIAQATKAYLARHSRLRAFYTPPHASWLNQAAWLLRAFSDTYLWRFDAGSCQPLIDHIETSWPEDNRRFAHPFTWSWSWRALYAWARKKDTVICTKTYATAH